MTEQGFEELRQLEPMVEVHRIQQAFDELTDIAQIFVENPYFSLAATSDIGPAMRRLELDTDLNIAELLAVKKVLEVSKSLLDFYGNLENVSLSQLDKLFEKIELFPHLQGSLQSINDAGFVEDFASEKLARIRRKIREAEDQVRQVMQDILKTKGDMLSDSILASRNGRNVLPVKIPIAIRLQGLSMTFQLRVRPFILSRGQW